MFWHVLHARECTCSITTKNKFKTQRSGTGFIAVPTFHHCYTSDNDNGRHCRCSGAFASLDD